MRRRSDYAVLLARVFTLAQWQYLEDSFSRHPDRGLYRLSPIGLQTTSTFNLSKVDHSYFTKDNINYLYWFFQGVVCSKGFPND